MATLCLVQRCPVFNDIGPYISIVTGDAHATVNSIYRGQDAETLLNKYGHSSQAQLYDGWIHHRPGFLPANPPGFSTHELHSDGVAYPAVPRGGRLPWWGCGFDVNDSDVEHCVRIAASYGWELWRPYSSGSEFHHLNFKRVPQPGRQRMRIYRLRRTLPRS